jgi:hypothetical protein
MKNKLISNHLNLSDYQVSAYEAKRLIMLDFDNTLAPVGKPMQESMAKIFLEVLLNSKKNGLVLAINSGNKISSVIKKLKPFTSLIKKQDHSYLSNLWIYASSSGVKANLSPIDHTPQYDSIFGKNVKIETKNHNIEYILNQFNKMLAALDRKGLLEEYKTYLALVAHYTGLEKLPFNEKQEWNIPYYDERKGTIPEAPLRLEGRMNPAFPDNIIQLTLKAVGNKVRNEEFWFDENRFLRAFMIKNISPQLKKSFQIQPGGSSSIDINASTGKTAAMRDFMTHYTPPVTKEIFTNISLKTNLTVEEIYNALQKKNYTNISVLYDTFNKHRGLPGLPLKLQALDEEILTTIFLAVSPDSWQQRIWYIGDELHIIKGKFKGNDAEIPEKTQSITCKNPHALSKDDQKINHVQYINDDPTVAPPTVVEGLLEKLI